MICVREETGNQEMTELGSLFRVPSMPPLVEVEEAFEKRKKEAFSLGS